MKSQVIFRIEHEPKGYGRKFAMDCKIEIKSTFGFIHRDYNAADIVGRFENMRIEGEVVLADIILDDPLWSNVNKDFAVDGYVRGLNEKGEVNDAQFKGISVTAI